MTASTETTVGEEMNGPGTFANENWKFWQPYTEKLNLADDKFILVDLLVGHPGYIIGNASIAKYLQAHLGCEVIGLIPNNDIPGFTTLARSFGITRVISEPDFDQNANAELMPILGQIINSLRVNDIKETILNMQINSTPVGDLVYDSYLRDTGKSTISGLDDDLARTIYMFLVYFKHYANIVNRLDILATVQAHVVYARFGPLARLALQKGAHVFARKPADTPLYVRRFRSVDELPSFELRLSQREFDRVWENNRAEAVRAGRRYLEGRFAGKDSLDDAESAFGPEKIPYRRAQILAELGLPSDRFTVFIMAHSFCDAPHTHNWSIYNDFHEWIVDTIRCISAVENVNWIVKPHPCEEFYVGSVTAKQIVSDLIKDIPHVAFAPDNLHTSPLPDLADAIVTIMGTAGLELPAFGVPAVLAGESAYSGFGFTNEPKTVEEYRETLTNIETITKPTEEQIERALVFTYLYFILGRVDSGLVPRSAMPNSSEYNENSEQYWYTAAALVRDIGSPENDPVYRNFTKLLHSDGDHLLNFDILGL